MFFHVQEQLRNQIDVVDQERNRVKRLRKERDIHEASALGAKTKERNLEWELENEKAAREMEVGNLKDLLDHEVALKRNLEDVLRARNTEFEAVSRELQYSKDDRMAINRVNIENPISSYYFILPPIGCINHLVVTSRNSLIVGIVMSCL
jgi:hypothetical protein